MAVDRYTIEYHLTDAGWISGSTSYFGKTDHHVDRPEGTHETWEYECSQQSGWSKEETSWQRIWVNPETATEHVKGLHHKFPSPRS